MPPAFPKALLDRQVYLHLTLFVATSSKSGLADIFCLDKHVSGQSNRLVLQSRLRAFKKLN
jgi:hypothetical protein